MAVGLDNLVMVAAVVQRAALVGGDPLVLGGAGLPIK